VQPYNQQVDILLEHKVQAIDPQTNQIAELPDFDGISGCSVWAVFEPAKSNDRIWSTSRAARIVAIETSYSRKLWIRTRKWFIAKKIIEHLENT
jgi:hypothetical protein